MRVLLLPSLIALAGRAPKEEAAAFNTCTTL
jgi:hypothetical protein